MHCQGCWGPVISGSLFFVIEWFLDHRWQKGHCGKLEILSFGKIKSNSYPSCLLVDPIVPDIGSRLNPPSHYHILLSNPDHYPAPSPPSRPPFNPTNPQLPMDPYNDDALSWPILNWHFSCPWLHKVAGGWIEEMRCRGLEDHGNAVKFWMSWFFWVHWQLIWNVDIGRSLKCLGDIHCYPWQYSQFLRAIVKCGWAFGKGDWKRSLFSPFSACQYRFKAVFWYGKKLGKTKKVRGGPYK